MARFSAPVQTGTQIHVQLEPGLFLGGEAAGGWRQSRWKDGTAPLRPPPTVSLWFVKMRLKCDGTRAETRFRLSAKRTSPFKWAKASVQSTAGSRGVRISGSNAGYTMFRGSVKSTGYPLHSPVSPSLPLSCVTVCHHISTGLYIVNLMCVCPCIVAYA